jgi:hypothetical protein
MAKQDEYRNYARDAVRLASHASSTAKKSLLLALAERWLDLADAQNKRASRPGFRPIEGDQAYAPARDQVCNSRILARRCGGRLATLPS